MATKAELLDEVAGTSGVSKADVDKILSAFFELVTARTKKGEKVAWAGFGSFSTSKSKARTGRNPQTGAAVKIAASTRMKFSASSTLKDALNSRGAAKKAAPAAKAAPAKKAAPAAKAAPAKKAAPAAKAAPAKKAAPAAKAAPAKKAAKKAK